MGTALECVDIPSDMPFLSLYLIVEKEAEIEHEVGQEVGKIWEDSGGGEIGSKYTV